MFFIEVMLTIAAHDVRSERARGCVLVNLHAVCSSMVDRDVVLTLVDRLVR